MESHAVKNEPFEDICPVENVKHIKLNGCIPMNSKEGGQECQKDF